MDEIDPLLQTSSLAGYPPSANRPRLRRMVKPTLSKMLSTIQNRQPLPNGWGLSCGHLHHEWNYNGLMDTFSL